jgi:ribosomal protein S18 acetylase RimI-like enzyme
MALLIRVLGRGDERILKNVAASLFDNLLDENLTTEFFGDPRHHMTVAVDDGLVVGFASAVHHKHPDKAPQLRINQVAVAPQHRRLGLAKALLRELLEVGRIHRCSVAWALTTRANAAATALYSSVGGIEWADDQDHSDGTLGYTFTLRCGPEAATAINPDALFATRAST